MLQNQKAMFYINDIFTANILSNLHKKNNINFNLMNFWELWIFCMHFGTPENHYKQGMKSSKWRQIVLLVIIDSTQGQKYF